MRLPHRALLFPTLLAAAATLAAHPARGAAPVLDAMKQELQRSVETLSKQPTPLYFPSYELTGNRRYSVRASFGNITGSSEGERAVVDVDLREVRFFLTKRNPMVTATLELTEVELRVRYH